MPTNVRTDNNDLVTQYARGTVFQQADPVLLKPKGDPGVAPHFNISTTIKNPAGTVYDHKTKVAHSESYMGQGKHLPIVIVGRNTGQVDGDNGFLSWAKTLYVEGRGAVMHGVQTGVNALWSMLPPAVKNIVQNGGQVAGGMTTKDFADAARDDAEAMLNALKSTDTLIALAQTAALMGVSAIPVVGQIAGGAAAVQRIKSAVEATAGAADELKAMMDRWSKPMSPTQIAAERKKLASFLIRVGVSAILAALGKAMGKLSARSKGKENSTKDVEVGTAAAPAVTGCPCKRGRPVIVATGEKTLTQADFSLPSTLSLEWTRVYRSGDERIGWFGQGWSAPLCVELQLFATELGYRDENGRTVILPAPGVGAAHFDPYEQFTVKHPSVNDWEICFKDGITQHFVRSSQDQLVLPLCHIWDRNNNRITLTYPGEPADPMEVARPDYITDASGRVLQLSWSDARLLTGVRLQDSALKNSSVLSTYQYDQDQNLVAHLDSNGGLRTYEWRNNILTAYTTADGARYVAQYDEYSPFGRVVHSFSEQSGQGLHFSYSDRARTTLVTDSLGRQTCYAYNDRKDVVLTRLPDGTSTETPYDANGNRRGAKDGLGRQTHYRFDKRGNIIEIVDTAGARTVIDYNEADQAVCLTDAMQNKWERKYDERGNLTAVINPLGHKTAYVNDTRGLPITVIDAQGGVKKLKWDAFGNLIAHQDCTGSEIHLEYDFLGRLTRRTDAMGQSTMYSWDAVGRLTSMREPDGAEHQYEWSAGGQLVSYLDPEGARTRYFYNGDGDLVRRVDANNCELQYVYDESARLVRLVNENGDFTEFRYDILDRLTDEISFDGRHQRYCYDAAGEVTHIVEPGEGDHGPGKVTRLERDAAGRMIARIVECDPASEATYSYDILGRMQSATNRYAQLSFAYDPLSQLLSETQVLSGGTQLSLKHAYDELGNRIQTTFPDERKINTLFYGKGHVHQVNLEEGSNSLVIADIERNKNHQEVQRRAGAVERTFSYDPMGRLTGFKRQFLVEPMQDGQITTSRSYVYDHTGRLTRSSDDQNGEKRFLYDPLGQILQASGRIDEYFSFDPAGNILDTNLHSPNKAPGNRISSFKGQSYAYDAYGNVQSRVGSGDRMELLWNGLNELVEAECNNNGVLSHTSFEYDALGRRTRKHDQFGCTEFLWDGNLLAQSRRGGRVSLFLFEPNTYFPMATIQDGEVFWYECDQIGTPIVLLDNAGRAVWDADYAVWGKQIAKRNGTDGTIATSYARESNRIEQPFRFQGQQFDAETGLHYNRFRYYDPWCGRFISPDPIGLAGGTNVYAYAPNPFSWSDPLGLKSTAKLRQGMKASGVTCPKGYAAHHKIAEQFEDHPALAEAKKRGIWNINEGSNGVPLPRTQAESLATGKPLHSGNHLGTYYDEVLQGLDKIGTVPSKLAKMSDAQLLGKINGVENKLHSMLEQDQIRLQSTDPRPPGTICSL
ncbi:hypothetical protein CR152_06615 [Massilia violaceinigra]|uniref:Type IV secretion protein Rhs n=1 Tax=Massilia violaceinigra TaxID=2045208 RepID=A0A2D2DGU1_9BURK|nr:RHS repeat-associated core domain-containing protein [Massilia violaceinigra]ATQ74208.1 hypothetical protein CR152_06615 [Massilia violaceinigra]